MLSNDAFAFDSTTRKRLDEIDEELKKLQAAYSKHNQQVSSQEVMSTELNNKENLHLACLN